MEVTKQQVEQGSAARKATTTGVCIKDWGTTMACTCMECSEKFQEVLREFAKELGINDQTHGRQIHTDDKRN